MAAKHKYIIIFNNDSGAEKNTYLFQRTSIRIKVSRQAATISFEMSVEKTVRDFTEFSFPLFRDAYRKVHLLHAVQFNCGLDVKKIDICIDGARFELNETAPHFPFLFSMIGDGLNLSPEWASLTKPILETTKSKMDEDFRFSAMFSFLMAQSRITRIDRFGNLWTSMNAYYSYLGKCYEKKLIKDYMATEEEVEKVSISAESDLIGAAVWQLDEHYAKVTKKEAAEKWHRNYVVEEFAPQMSRADLEELYNTSLKALKGKEIPEKYKALNENAAKFGVSLYTFLLFNYPYHYRCNLFHGNRSTELLAAYNDYEIAVLGLINHFLESFLKEGIPKLFEDSFWNDTKQEKMERYITEVAFDNNKKKMGLMENLRSRKKKQEE